jgi:hypothetical protein
MSERDAARDLEEFLLEGEVVETIVFGEWGSYGYEDEDDSRSRVPNELRLKPLNFNEARKYMKGWSFDGGFGSAECYAVTIWTNRRVIAVHEYDGSTQLMGFPRNPEHVTPQFDGCEVG